MDEKVTSLQQCYLFKGLLHKDLVDIATKVLEKKLRKNTLLIEEGTRGKDEMYIITSGLVKVFYLTEDGKEVILDLKSSGYTIGEFKLLEETQQVRSANVQALEDTRVYILSKEDFLIDMFGNRFSNVFINGNDKFFEDTRIMYAYEVRW